MRRTITLFALLLISSFSFAQYSPVGHLTIFSEDGDKFQLILNGEVINDTPQSNLRVEDLNQPYYSAKIRFQDKTVGEISKNNLMIADADGNFSDVTYKIKRDRNNRSKAKLNYFSAVPVNPDFIPASNVHVVHYGSPVMTQTTTTTTMTEGMAVGVNSTMGGVSMNVTVHEPMGTSVTQTTTTTHSGGNQYYEEPEGRRRGCSGNYAMAPGNFSSALTTVKNLGFDDTRLKTAKQIVSSNCMNVKQISDLASTFGFEETKLEFAKFAYDYCVEPKNYFKLNNIFGFSASVEELTDYISSRN